MKWYLIVASVLIILSSCVLSLNPLTEKEDDLIFKKELLGNWKVIKEKGKASGDYENDVSYMIDTLNGSEGKRYKITYITSDTDSKKSDTSYLLGIVVKLPQGYFIDCSTDTSRESFKQLDELAKGLLISSHIISRFRIVDGNTISIFHMDTDKLEDLINAKKIILKHSFSIESELLLLEETADLQKKLNEPGGLITTFTREETIKRQ